MHAIGALLIAGFLLHHAIYAGRYGAQPQLMWLWIALTTLALGSVVYVYLIEPLREYSRPWQVASIARLTPKQWSIKLSPVGHKGLDYKAGQFAWLNIGHSPFTVFENPFSISSAPVGGADVEFVIKELGDFSGSLEQIKPGTRAYLDAPYGSLCIEGYDDVPGIALIAGGVGVAPMLSILRQMHLTGDQRPSVLVYGNRKREQIVCAQELERLAQTPTTEIVHILSEPDVDWAGETGMVDGALLDRVFTAEQFESWLFVLCGPPRMIEKIEVHLVAHGTPSDRILSERFTYD